MSRWDGIEEFLAVASGLSFTRGAEALGCSTTQVSRAIKALEAKLQAALFHRTTRIVRLTDTGQAFLLHCERIAQDTDESIALVAEEGEPQGELRVSCSTALGERFIAPILLRFALDHPRLRVRIDLTNRVVDLLGEGFDLAIRTGQLPDSRLLATRVASRAFSTCASPSYLASVGRPASVMDLENHECLVGSINTWRFDRRGHETHFRPRGRFRCNSGHAILEACRAGLGICQLPDFYVAPLVERGELELVLEDVRPKEEPIWAVYPQHRHLMPKVRSAIDRLKDELEPSMAGI